MPSQDGFRTRAVGDASHCMRRLYHTTQAISMAGSVSGPCTAISTRHGPPGLAQSGCAARVSINRTVEECRSGTARCAQPVALFYACVWGAMTYHGRGKRVKTRMRTFQGGILANLHFEAHGDKIRGHFRKASLRCADRAGNAGPRPRTTGVSRRFRHRKVMLSPCPISPMD